MLMAHHSRQLKSSSFYISMVYQSSTAIVHEWEQIQTIFWFQTERQESWEHCKIGSAQWGSEGVREGEIKWESFVTNPCWQPEVLHISGLKFYLWLDSEGVQSIVRRRKFGAYKEHTQRASHGSIWKLLLFQLMTDVPQSQKDSS